MDDQPKEQICEGANDELSFELIEFEVPVGYLSINIYTTVHRQYWGTSVDTSRPQVSNMLLASRPGAQVKVTG